MQGPLGAFQINLIVFIFGLFYLLVLSAFRIGGGGEVCIYYNTLYTRKCVA